jgi:hypothetical protein
MAVRVPTRPPAGAYVYRWPDTQVGRPADRVRHGPPALALVATVCVAAVVFGAVAQLVATPLVNPDELDYTLAARTLADGGWPSVRGHEYGFGPVYPAVLAPVVALSGGVDAAYPFFKVANALLFALAAVPAFLLARRLLSPWWSVAVAAASLAIPSSIYTSLVMTESTAYLVSTVALLAVVLALERPSVARQLAMLSAVTLAYATRAQFATLLPAFVAATALLWSIDPRRLPLRRALLRLWPTFAAVSLGVAVLAAGIVLTSWSARDVLGGYRALWRGYDPGAVATFVVYHLAGWELYLFVVPFVVMPIVVAELVRDARRGGIREAAFVSTFLTVNAAMLLVAAAFATTPYGYSSLHDRYLFYVAPLWLTGFAVWLSRGLPRPVVWTAAGAAIALVLPAVVPFGMVGGNVVFEEVPTAFWSWTWTVVHATPHLDGRRVLSLTGVALTAAAVALPRRVWPILPAVVVAGLAVTSAFAWGREVDEPADLMPVSAPDDAWVDDAVPQGARVTKLYVASPRCPETEETRQALFLTEFFNVSVKRAAAIGGSDSDGLPLQRVDVGSGGRLLLPSGRPLAADYVVTPPGIAVDGRPVAEGTGADLVLWKVDGAVRMAGTGLHTLGVEARAPDCG